MTVLVCIKCGLKTHKRRHLIADIDHRRDITTMRLPSPGPLTTRAFASLPPTGLETGGAGGSSAISGLIAQDAALRLLHSGSWPASEPPQFVRTLGFARPSEEDALSADVCVCGGTLGLLVACALQLKGHRVAVVEAGPLRGRAQDWNTSEDELRQLVAAGVLDESELPLVAPLSFGPMSCRFGRAPTFELKLKGVLDVAVSPRVLLETVRARFEAAGGVVLESSPVRAIRIHPDGAALELAAGQQTTVLHSRLVLDCMGHRSPIALQQRNGQRPDGVCVQVGACCAVGGRQDARWSTGSPPDVPGDFFVTADDAVRAGPRGRARMQYFWQAFPSCRSPSERSTYLFTYLRPGEEMPGLLDVMEDYWRLLPSYGTSPAKSSQVSLASDAVSPEAAQRILFGWFPTYRRNSPLAPAFDRILSIGDASAVQSPISFGGFCAMLRHLPRYSRGLDLALTADRLSRDDLCAAAA